MTEKTVKKTRARAVTPQDISTYRDIPGGGKSEKDVSEGGDSASNQYVQAHFYSYFLSLNLNFINIFILN